MWPVIKALFIAGLITIGIFLIIVWIIPIMFFLLIFGGIAVVAYVFIKENDKDKRAPP